MTSSCTITITSRLGSDPEMQYLPSSGNALTKLSLPVDVGWGENKYTEWVKVTCFGGLAERCNEHLRKGSLVTVVGELDKTWVNDKNVASIQVKAVKVDFLADFGKQQQEADTF